MLQYRSIAIALACCLAPAAFSQAVPETKRDVSPSIVDTARDAEERARIESGREGVVVKKEHKVRRLPLPKKKARPEAAPAAPAQPTPPAKKLPAKEIIQFEG